MSRPESDGRGYELPDDYDRDAWMEFTPWRPGNPSTAGEAPYGPTVREMRIERGDLRTPGHDDGGSEGGHHRRHAVESQERRGQRWWTEDASDRFATGDKVRSRGEVRGDFMSHVPANTRGKVVGTQIGALSGEWATVEFENGYTEVVRMGDLKRDSWL